MRRMIPGKLIEKIKSLFTSLRSDDEGNVEIGKDLEVDGGIKALGANATLYSYPAGDTQSGLKLCAEDNLELVISAGSGQDSSARIDFSTNDFSGGMFFTNRGIKGGVITIGGDYDVEISSNLKVNGVPFELYRHHLTLTTASGTDCQDYYSHSNLVVDSIQDLTTITGGHPFGSGAGYTYASNVWKHGTANVTAVSDDVQLVTN